MLRRYNVGIIILLILSLFISDARVFGKQRTSLSEKVKRLEEDIKGLDKWLQTINGDHESLLENMKHIRKSIEEVSEEVERLDTWIKELTAGHKALVMIVKNLNRKVNQLTHGNTDVDINEDTLMMKKTEDNFGEGESLD